MGLLAGCSAVRLGYDSLPSFTYWWADGYVDFGEAQSLRIRQDLAELQAWHRHQELPQVLAWLKQAEALAAQQDVDPAQVCALVPPLSGRLEALRQQLGPPLMRLGRSLRPEQILRLTRKYVDNEARYRQEWVDLSPADLQDKRTRELGDRLEKLYGRLQDDQRQTLSATLRASRYQPALSLQEHHRRHEDILATLRDLQQAPPAAAQALWEALSQRMLVSPDPAYRQQLQDLVDEHCSVVAAVQRQSTAEQRANAVQRLQGWQRDVQALMAEP